MLAGFWNALALNISPLALLFLAGKKSGLYFTRVKHFSTAIRTFYQVFFCTAQFAVRKYIHMDVIFGLLGNTIAKKNPQVLHQLVSCDIGCRHQSIFTNMSTSKRAWYRTDTDTGASMIMIRSTGVLGLFEVKGPKCEKHPIGQRRHLNCHLEGNLTILFQPLGAPGGGSGHPVSF